MRFGVSFSHDVEQGGGRWQHRADGGRLCLVLSGGLVGPAGWGSHSARGEMEVLRDKNSTQGPGECTEQGLNPGLSSSAQGGADPVEQGGLPAAPSAVFLRSFSGSVALLLPDPRPLRKPLLKALQHGLHFVYFPLY